MRLLGEFLDTVSFGISYLLLPKSRHLLASISSFKSIASTLSNPITTMKPICGSGIGKKGKIFKVKAAETRRQRRITSNQMSKNEIGWELRHFADGCLQEGGTRDSKEGRRKLLATDQSLCLLQTRHLASFFFWQSCFKKAPFWLLFICSFPVCENRLMLRKVSPRL